MPGTKVHVQCRCMWIALCAISLVWIGLIVLCLSLEQWFYSNDDEYAWEGSLRAVVDGYKDWKGKPYLKIKEDLCVQTSEDRATLCNLFTSLSSASTVVVLIEGTSIFLMVITAALVLSKFTSYQLFSCSYFFLLCVYALNCSTLFYLIEQFDLSFTGDCDDITPSKDRFKLCASKGPMLFAAQLLLLSLYILVFFALGFCTRYDKIEPEATAQPDGPADEEEAQLSHDELVQRERWAEPTSSRPLANI